MGGKSNNQNGGGGSSNRSSGSEFSLVTLTAVLHHYNPDTLKWIVVGPSRIGIYHDPEANSFRIVARRLAEEGHEVVANCPVGEHFSYNESTPSFHQWRDVGVQVMGVKFSSTDEGALFADTVRRILATFESVARMMLESGALAEEQQQQLPHPSHPHNPHQHQYLPLNHHHHQHHQQQYQQSPPQNPPPPVPGGGSSTSSSSSNGGSLYGGSGDLPAHFAAAPMRGKPVPPPPPPPNGSCKNGGGQLNQAKPAIQPKPGFLNEMEITLARRRAKIEAADSNGGGGGGSQVEIGFTGREQQVVHLPLRANSTSELQQQQPSLSSFSGVSTFLNKSINGLHPSSSFSNPSSPSIELLPTGNNSSNGLSSAQLPPLALEKLKQEILGEIRQEFAAFKMDLLQVIKEQMSSQG